MEPGVYTVRNMGDMSRDEVNIIQQEKNYGWPKVDGVSDNKLYPTMMIDRWVYTK